MTMTYKILAKICAAISGSSIVYMFLIAYEGTYFGWTVFFIFLAFAILFHALDEKEEEIAILRSPKEGGDKAKQSQDIKRKEQIDPRSYDPFYLPDTIEKRLLLEEIVGQKDGVKGKETNSSQNQDTKDSPVEEMDVLFIPKYHTGMQKQWGSSPKKDNQPQQHNDKS